MPLLEPTTLCRQENDGFLTLLAPEINAARQQLQEVVDQLAQQAPVIQFDPKTVVDLFYESLPGRLLAMVGQTLVLELQVARIQGLLVGETSAARYDDFVCRLAQTETAAALWEEYPVLAQQMRQCIDQWVTFSVEVLRHLVADRPKLIASFNNGQELGCLTQIAGDSGDRHRDGRSVLMLDFSSGIRLVYKPKPLAAEVRFAELLDWLNARGAQPTLRATRVLDCGEYGWAAFVPFQSCHSVAAVERFYERQGSLLALLHTLSATDFHFENLIACGEHPVVIDLESLFHQQLRHGNNDPASVGYLNSVAKVRLLPQPISVPDLPEAVDFSGLGAQPGQPTPFFVADWEGAGTDEVHIVQRRIATGTGKHRPALNGEHPDASQYLAKIEIGFIRMYRLLMEHRDALLDGAGPIAAFADAPLRFIARPSQIYQILLQASHHPDRLRDPNERQQLFARLNVRVEQTPALARLLKAELADLERGDIPHFATQPNSRDLKTSDGETIVDFFERTGQAVVQERLQALSEGDLCKQQWLIRASFASLVKSEPEAVQASVAAGEIPTIAAELRAARSMADSLCRLAWWRDGAASWIGFVRRDRTWSVEPLDLSAEHGLSGVAVFLAQMGALTGELGYLRLAEGAWTTIERRQAALSQQPMSPEQAGVERDVLAAREALQEILGQRQKQPASAQPARCRIDRLFITAAVRSLHLGHPVAG